MRGSDAHGVISVREPHSIPFLWAVSVARPRSRPPRRPELRLQITNQECAAVPDHVAEQHLVRLTVDYVETVVWDLFGNRFIEP